MINDLEGLLGALAVLELRGGDTDAIEAKTFSEYSAQQLGPTLSAFANMPGGGVILLGVSERDGIAVVGVDDVHGLLQRVADQARKGFSAPVRIDALPINVDGKTVGVVNVEGADANEKPVRWLKDKKAYLRQYDGDYQMSPSEEQMLLLRHRRPIADAQAVPGSSSQDLDADLVAHYLASVRKTTPRLVNDSDEAVLTSRASLPTVRVESCRLPASTLWVSTLSVFCLTSPLRLRSKVPMMCGLLIVVISRGRCQ